MKIIKNIALITVFILSASCNDAIDIIQPGELGADVVFTSVDDLQLGLNAVYFGLNTKQAIEISSFFTDETAPGIENSGQNLDLLRFQLTSVSAIPNNLWLGNYTTISGVNRIIEAADKIEVSAAERQKYDDILAQLFAIRAAEYFELLTFYSPDISDENALGVMKLDFVPSITDELPRVTNAEIFALIENDLMKAKTMLDVSRNDPAFITTHFIAALEARMALYRGQNADAITLAQGLIDQFPLADRLQYVDLFRDINNTEVIFKGERNQGNNSSINDIYYFRDASITGGAFMEMGRALFNILDPNDIRYDVLLQQTSNVDIDYQLNGGKDDVLLIGKYEGSGGQPMLNDYKYFRVSEMYLIKAEAQANENDLTGAAETLKTLRDARLLAPSMLASFTSQSEALTAVLEERRIELAFEGHRYVDLKRLSPIIGVGIDRDPVDCQQFNACTLGTDEFFKFTFPIPQNELSGNRNIRNQQNPGYE